jgi:hypothetical protein
MDFKNIAELKDISVKHFIDFFKCNKGIAKELMKILKDYRENKIFYNFVETDCCCIKLYIFDKGDMFKVYKIEYLEKDKKINKLYEYNLQNNSIVKEKLKDK